jgi:hypothetical protein
LLSQRRICDDSAHCNQNAWKNIVPVIRNPSFSILLQRTCLPSAPVSVSWYQRPDLLDNRLLILCVSECVQKPFCCSKNIISNRIYILLHSATVIMFIL